MLIGPALPRDNRRKMLVEPPGIAPGSGPLIPCAFIPIVRLAPSGSDIAPQGAPGKARVLMGRPARAGARTEPHHDRHHRHPDRQGGPGARVRGGLPADDGCGAGQRARERDVPARANAGSSPRLQGAGALHRRRGCGGAPHQRPLQGRRPRPARPRRGPARDRDAGDGRRPAPTTLGAAPASRLHSSPRRAHAPASARAAS